MIQPGDFYEDDEPVEDVIAAFEAGEKFLTDPATDVPHGWFCQHYTLTSSLKIGRPVVGCGCTMTPLAGTR